MGDRNSHRVLARAGRRARLLATTTLLGLGLLNGEAEAQSASTPPVVAHTQQGTIIFAIPGQPMATAVVAFSRASGINVVAGGAIAAGLRTQGVIGALTPRQGLLALLAGSGLSFRFTGARSVTIFDPATMSSAQAMPDGALVLDTIQVQGDSATGSGYLGTPDWVYETPGSVSVISREAIQQSGARNSRDLLGLSSGVYSGEGQGSFPTVSPNIRGVQDSGRVVVSIDGARQNAQDGGRYGSSGVANFGGAFVDTAFIREIDINKNPTAAAGNAGSLGGTVDFRTVGARDIIKGGKTWGIELDATRGTNKHNFQGSLLTAFRLTEHLALTTGVSRLSLGQFEPGENGTGGGTFGLTNRDAVSTFAKLEGDFGDLKTSASWMRQTNNFAYTPSGTTDGLQNRFKARNDSAVADFSWDPVSPLIGLKGKLWLNSSMVDETRDARISSGILISPETKIDKDLTSFGGVLQNTSALQTDAGALTLNYGVEAFRDQGDKSASSDEITKNPLFETSYGAFNPDGRRDVASLFLNGKWEPANWVNVSAGLRYDWYRLKGAATYYNRKTTTTGVNRIIQPIDIYLNYMITYQNSTYVRLNTICSTGINPLTGNPVTPAQRTSSCNSLTNAQNRRGEIIDGRFYDAGVTYYGTVTTTTYPANTLEIDRTEAALLPSVTVEFTPVDWFRPYVSYSHSFRPPTITEAFIAGGLTPSDAVGLNLAPNANLGAETARTWEIGFNVSQNGLFTASDHLRLKGAVFNREIDDYIVMGYIQAAAVAGWEYLSFVNAADTTTMRGIEIEGNYDEGRFWFGGSATWLKTQWPTGTDTFNNGSTTMTQCQQFGCGTTTSGDIYAVSGNVPPQFKMTLDAGLRFFDQRLTVGARFNYVKPTLSRVLDADTGGVIEITEPYSTLDLYSSLRLDDKATLRFSITNVADVNYVPASANYSAPGRTFLFGANLKL